MKVTVEQVRDNLAKLTIEVSPEEFGVALDKALDKKQNTKDCRYIAIP